MDRIPNPSKFIVRLVNYLRRILLVDLVCCAGVGVSFIATSGLSSTAYSDRIFWVGIGAILLGGVGIFTIAIAGSDFGNPRELLKTEGSPGTIERFRDLRASLESRYDFCILMWLVGLSLIGISALIQQVFSLLFS